MSRSNCVDSLSHSFRYSIVGLLLCVPAAAILVYIYREIHIFVIFTVCLLFAAFRGISLFRFALIPYTLAHSFDRKLILFDRCWVSLLSSSSSSLSSRCRCRCCYFSLSAHCSLHAFLLQCFTKWWFRLKLWQMFRIIM